MRYGQWSGGKIYIGKDDDGNTVDLGINETRRLLESIPNSIVQALNYSNVSVDAKKDDNGLYIEIIVHKSDFPVFYQGSMYKRIGTANFKVEGPQQQNALIEDRNRTWDSSVVDNVSIDDLDEESFEIFREEAISSGKLSGKALESREKILEELELIKDGKFTVAAVLLFHRKPSKVVSGASVLIGKMRNDADVVSSDEIKGSLMMLSRSILDILKVKYLYALISYDMPTRIETYPYPFDALREAVFNSLMHNDWSSGQSILIKVYDHSLSILNRAIIDEDWTVVHHKSRHINPLISNVFNKAGLVEKFGTGITKMIDSCKNAGNPEPLFETAADGMDFCVTFKTSKIYRALEKYRELNDDVVVDYRKVLAQIDKLTENNSDGTINCTDGTITKTKTPIHDSKSNDYIYSRKKRLLSELKRNSQITLDQLEAALSLPRRTIARDIEWLKENGYLERIGSKKSGSWHVIKELE